VSFARARGGGVDLDVHVVPRASKTRIAGVVEARLKVQLNAPPVDGEANAALVRLIADELDVRKSAVSIVAGETSRHKRVHVEGVALEVVLALGAAEA
jgi:uncharacterized protein (TIGR00251 family)